MKNFDFLEDREIMELSKPSNFQEEELLNLLIKNLGEITTINKLSNFLNLSKSFIYKALDERRILAYKSGSRTLILTKTVLNIIRSRNI